MKELYLLPDEERRLFGGIDKTVTPASEFGETLDVEAASWADRETVSVSGRLPKGDVTIDMAFVNNEEWFEGIDGDRNLRLDRLEILDAQGHVVISQELEEIASARGCEWNTAEEDHFAFYCEGSLTVQATLPMAGDYILEVVAWGDQYEDEPAKLEVLVESDSVRSAGSLAIKSKLVDLYDGLHGLNATVDSPEVASAYELFVDVWERRRNSDDTEFFDWNEGIACDWGSDHYYLDGIVDRAFVWKDDWDDEWGARYDWDWNLVNAHFETIDWSDTHGVAESWTVVLAYLMMDYRYLYL